MLNRRFIGLILASLITCQLLGITAAFSLDTTDGSPENQTRYREWAERSEQDERKAKELIKGGDRESALIWLQKAVNEFPPNYSLVLEEVDCLTAMGRTEQALKVLDEHGSPSPEDCCYLIARANVLFKLRRFEESLKLCDSFNYVDEAFILRSQIYAQTGRRKLALEQAQIAYYSCYSLNRDSKDAVSNLKALGFEVPAKVTPIERGNQTVFKAVDQLLASGPPTQANLEKIFHRHFEYGHPPYATGWCAIDFKNLFFNIHCDTELPSEPGPKLTICIDTNDATVTKEKLEQRYPQGIYNPGSHSGCERYGSSYKYSGDNVDVWFEFWDDGFRPVKIISIYWKKPKTAYGPL